MEIKLTTKKVIIVAGVAILLISGMVLYLKSYYSSPRGEAYVTRAATDEGEAADKTKQGGGDADAGADAKTAAVASEIFVDIAGAVKKPGVLALAVGSRVFQAIEAAGGGLANADTKVLNLAAVLNDGEHIYVPTKEETAKGDYVPPAADAGSGGQSGASGTGAGGGSNAKVNINTADAAGLQQLNGVGPSTAQKIIDYRNSNGKFRTPEDLKQVSGIGEKTFAKLKDHICV